jgi:hypothetical protein
MQCKSRHGWLSIPFTTHAVTAGLRPADNRRLTRSRKRTIPTDTDSAGKMHEA